MMALAGVEPKTLVSEPDALTTRPPPCKARYYNHKQSFKTLFKRHQTALQACLATQR